MKISKLKGIIILMAVALIVLPVAASVTFQSSVPKTIAEGDRFVIRGTDATNGSVAIWVIGRNYFDIRFVKPDEHGTYTFILKPDETRNFSSGQYAVVIQDPGANRQFEIEPRISGTGTVTLLNNGVIYADVGEKQNFKADVQPVITMVLAATTSPDTDDIVTPYYFFVELPSIHFDRNTDPEWDIPLQVKISGKPVVIRGTTNMGVENVLTATVRTADTNKPIMATILPLIAGSNNENGNILNRWEYELNPSGLPAGEYFLTIGWQKEKTLGTGTILFTVS
ncbi:MAG: hypothetical protein WCH85_03995 [Methanomicrobiales archaeon]